MSKIKNLALIGIGLVLGVGISFAPDINAAASKLLGGKVTKVITVKKNGQTIGEGGVINGTTYLPVRALVNAVDGIEVESVNSSEVNLTTKESDGVRSSIAQQEQDAMNEKAAKISKLNNEISALKIKIKNVQSVADEPTFESTANIKKELSFMNRESNSIQNFKEN